MKQNGYLIEEYCKYDAWDRSHTVYKFSINEVWYGVKEVEVVDEVPQVPIRMSGSNLYHIYQTQEEAIEFARALKKINS